MANPGISTTYVYIHNPYTTLNKRLQMPILCMHAFFLYLDFLVRILCAVVFPQHNLPLLLCACMLDPHLLGHFAAELSDEARVPQLRRYA